ncbi:MAG: AEC family transporter [Candidatus Adiutrix sp.]
MLAIIQQAIDPVLTFFLMGLVGYVLDKRGWFTLETKAMLPRLVTLITLPPYLFMNILRTFSRDDLAEFVYGAMVPAISVLLTFALGVLLAKIIKVRKSRRGLFQAGFAASNTIFIGLPVNLALFGEAALPYVLLYFFSNTVFLWTVGVYCISRSGEGQGGPIASWHTLKLIFSPPLIGFFLGIAAVLLNFSPPTFVGNAANFIGDMTTPLAIIFIGITLAGVRLRNIKIDLDVIMLILGRFVFSPLILIGTALLMPIPPLMFKVFIIQASLPMVSTAVLLADYYRTDTQYASVAVSLTTIMALVTLPLYMLILSQVNF